MTKKPIAAFLVAGAVAAQADDSRSSASKIEVAPTAADKAPAKAKENTVALGITLTDGNSDTLLGTASFLHDRKRDGYFLRLGIDGAYAEDKDETATETVRGVAECRKNLSDRAYLIDNVSALYDSIAGVDCRVIVSMGPGYYPMKDDAATLSVDLGPAFITEKVGGETDDDWALRVGQRYERQLGATAKVWQALEYLPMLDDFDDYLLNAEIGIEAAVNSDLSRRLVVKNAYDSTPAADREKSDTTAIGALAYKL